MLDILLLLVLGVLAVLWFRYDAKRTEEEAARRVREREEEDRAYARQRAEQIAELHRNLDAMAHFIDAGYGVTVGKAVPEVNMLTRLPEEIETPLSFNARERQVSVPVANLLVGMRLVLSEAEAAANKDTVALAQLPWARVRVRPFHRGPSVPHCLVAHRPVKRGAVVRLDSECRITAIEPLVACDQDGENYQSWRQQ